MKKQNISEFNCDKLNSAPVVENSASAILDVSREESDLFQQDIRKNMKESRRVQMFNSMKLGGG